MVVNTFSGGVVFPGRSHMACFNVGILGCTARRAHIETSMLNGVVVFVGHLDINIAEILHRVSDRILFELYVQMSTRGNIATWLSCKSSMG